MDKLSVRDYLKLRSWSKRKQYLTSIIGNSEYKMIGKVNQIFDNYCKVINVRTISDDNGYNLFIPFEDGNAMSAMLGLANISKELISKNIGEGSIIIFSFTLNSREYEEKGKYFIIEENSIVKVEDCERFYKSIKLEKIYSRLFNGFSKDNNENKIYFAEDLKKAHKDILDEIEDKKQELAYLEGTNEKLKNDIVELVEKYESDTKAMKDKLEEDYNQKKLQLEKRFENDSLQKQKEIDEMKSNISELKRYNILSYEDEVSASENEEKIYKEDILERIKYIQGYLMLNNKKPLYYNEDIIKSLYAGLKTEQIIVLAGKPGSGKTSIVEGFADAINAELFLIPVQPNWMDKSDLLGFYNPIQKNYVSTPFLDVLLEASKEAEKNSNKIFFICLDEMNLSHVEYYFSEFLSKLQTDRKIQLYSKAIYEDIKEEIEERYLKLKSDISNLTIENFLQEHSGENIDNYFKLKKQYKMLCRYPYEILIPHNIKFLGTINKDETTKDLSPKVTDRSFIIKLENKLDIKDKKKLLEMFAQNKEQYTKKLDLSYKNIETQPIVLDEELENNIVKIKESLQLFNISINNRFDRTINELLAGESFNNTNEVLDLAIASLILPKINVSSEDADLEELKSVLEQISIGKPISFSVLQWMLSYNDENLTYWR